ncbi:hypothetical protein DF3PA_50069 [Candidatus Defluviicoccus seviourii]|uniref:Uncharacterized protein n=1 Tax=Candidatus Defluviicoccus seviourii TaxID=2565273 RepID=A0A564WG26_9PROT|nr:hypothetical protein DF3PA_50069 [Candidatus Defluviicoccus seviourii]
MSGMAAAAAERRRATKRGVATKGGPDRRLLTQRTVPVGERFGCRHQELAQQSRVKIAPDDHRLDFLH